MNPRYFDAILKTEDDKFLEIGTACVSIEDQSIEFKNEFVPLLKLGEIVKIVRLDDNVETRSFTGEVYLSSRRLLRIVSAVDTILPGAINYLSLNTSISGQVALIPAGDSFLQQPSTKGFDAEIYYLSTKTIKFTTKKQFKIGQRLLLRSEDPVVLDMVALEIYQTILCGSNATGYRCNVLYIPEPAYGNLREYLEKSNLLFT
ncbi:hypothetical protein V6615_10540 [Oscillospiraceae bacterium PP1C4]